MHEHGPDDLAGPIRGSPAWWSGMNADPLATSDGPSEPTKPAKKRKDKKPIRMELVERVRKEIAAGTYDTQEKWEAALDRLLERLDSD